ncbi:hypothetical protein [Plantibacter sp. M259]|uniref:hypothetical protein n=1 Tax=Plantibacter sp. M259 TaxID=2583822 RepID=UPI0011104502|nr:hypothetical protein [Plantibacter sp. M259]
MKTPNIRLDFKIADCNHIVGDRKTLATASHPTNTNTGTGTGTGTGAVSASALIRQLTEGAATMKELIFHRLSDKRIRSAAAVATEVKGPLGVIEVDARSHSRPPSTVRLLNRFGLPESLVLDQGPTDDAWPGTGMVVVAWFHLSGVDGFAAKRLNGICSVVAGVQA